MLRRIGVLASLAMCVVMFAGVSSAQAQETAGACVFTGVAGSLNPALDNVIEELQNESLGALGAESGGFNYSTNNGGVGACAGVFEDDPGVSTTDPDLGDLEITSNGQYTNIVCGTGFAYDHNGLATTLEGENVLGGADVSVSGSGYQIAFVGGVGALLIGSGANLANNFDTAADTIPDTISSPYTGVGVVHITPGRDSDTLALAHRDNCIAPSDDADEDGTTDAFEVRGFFVAAG